MANNILINAKINAYQRGILNLLPIPSLEDQSKIIYVDDGSYSLKQLPETTYINSTNIFIEKTGDYDKNVVINLNDVLENISSITLTGTVSITNNNQLTTKQYVDDQIDVKITQVLNEIEESLAVLNTGSGVNVN